jgi:hypothetical protein
MNTLWQPLENLMDFNVWLFLQWYYAPMTMLGKGSEIDQWIASFSPNGMKAFNICKPQ